MKTRHHKLFATCASALAVCLCAGLASAQAVNTDQINWGSLDASTIVDSEGNTLDPLNFTFELGAFAEGFTPTESNVQDWYSNWFTFDVAVYNQSGGVFAGEYTMYDNNTDPLNGDFASLGISRDAYIWVYDSTTPEPGTEWFLASASNWQFPELADDCCNNALPLEWSMSDLTVTDVPLWGNQLGTEGSGEVTSFNGGADLQTYTFIPEPSSALLVALAGLMGVMRRSRPQC